MQKRTFCPLLERCREGNINDVKRIIEIENFDVNFVECGTTALNRAISLRAHGLLEDVFKTS